MKLIQTKRPVIESTPSRAALLAALFALVAGSAAHAASTQVGDLRLPSGNYSGAFTYFDTASSGDLTRAVVGAPVGINSNFLVASQNPDTVVNSADDIGLRTYSSVTTIRQLNRYASDQDGPGAGGGPQRAGAAQWTIDLSPLGTYLTSNSLLLTALDLRLVVDPTDDVRDYDVYLSYTNAAESIALASLSTGATSGDDNYDNFWFPAQSVAEGNVANGTHKVIERDFQGDMDVTIDLLSLYSAGVTDLNLIMSSGAFLSGDNFAIEDGSGISIDTAPIPEPSSLALLGLGGLLMARRRR